MKVENTQVQMRKGILEFCILEIIGRGETYASDMLAELTAARMLVVEGTLYPLLTRLKNAALLEYQWIESVSGPPRKYYVLTEDGRRFLSLLRQTWGEMVASILIIQQHPKAAKALPSPAVSDSASADNAAAAPASLDFTDLA